MSNPSKLTQKELWHRAVEALDGGDFSRLAELLESQGASLLDFLARNGEPRTHMEEAFAWCCFLGRTSDAEALLDKNVSPSGAMTGQTGFHYAAMGGHLDTVQMLIKRKAPMEIKNMYGGTVLGQALWSAVNEHKEDHSAIIEALIHAGAATEPRSLEWWHAQDVPSAETKRRVAAALAERSKE